MGSFIDSYLEYLWKAYVLFGHPDDLLMWTEMYGAVQQHMRHGPWYVEVHMGTGQWSWAAFSALQGYWPGVMATWGEVQDAADTMTSFFSLWERFGFVPERYDLLKVGWWVVRVGRFVAVCACVCGFVVVWCVRLVLVGLVLVSSVWLGVGVCLGFFVWVFLFLVLAWCE